MRRSEAELWTFVRARADELRRNPTKAESLLRDALGPEWIFQQGVVLKGPRGKLHPVIFDFVPKRGMVAVEVDGSSHRKKKGHDARRDRVCRFNGIRVIRLTNRQVEKDLDGCIKTIKEALDAG